MIDLEKDSNREAFESWATDKFPIAGLGQFEKHNNGTYIQRSIRNMYEAWQAAKAQAVPEVLKKFCNEHKDPAWRGRLTEYDKGYSDCCIAVLEMIEAQEPAND